MNSTKLNRTTMNKGYAFVNFTKAEAVSKFKAACNHKPWCHFYSKKEVEITFARIQASLPLLTLHIYTYLYILSYCNTHLCVGQR